MYGDFSVNKLATFLRNGLAGVPAGSGLTEKPAGIEVSGFPAGKVQKELDTT